ncbi:MAG: glycogen synthase GlgA [Gammaproteobacteria bacterium]|nr:glycogen synthase GlgA [Gammaproteobacteria bacterium]
MNVLFVSSEVYPLNKTGGLGDVAYGLSHALQEHGADVRLLIPAYRELMDKVDIIRMLGRLDVPGDRQTRSIRVLEARHPEFKVGLYLVDCQPLYDRPGNPYIQADGTDWPDNAERFSVFAQTAALIAMDALDTGWRPSVVHCNDWQTGLVPALLSDYPVRPKTIFTIHNLAYGGHFPQPVFINLQLPAKLWHIEGVEFYGGFSMLKAGIVYADEVTTVSPTYAREICTPEFGYAMDGILRSRQNRLSGILNGIDLQHWNPRTDRYLPLPYNSDNVHAGKLAAKISLLESFGRPSPAEELLTRPLMGMVGRLVEQKGIDLIIDTMPQILADTDAAFIFLGTGEAKYEQLLSLAAAENPGRVFTWIGFSEQKAHLLEAGADIFLMPSRFEPCGLNQMYSLRYGTPPVVHQTGGLADTIVNTSTETLRDGSANGFVFPKADQASFSDAMLRALDLIKDTASWSSIIRNGMALDLSWNGRARQYLELYSRKPL